MPDSLFSFEVLHIENFVASDLEEHGFNIIELNPICGSDRYENEFYPGMELDAYETTEDEFGIEAIYFSAEDGSDRFYDETFVPFLKTSKGILVALEIREGKNPTLLIVKDGEVQHKDIATNLSPL